MVKAVFLDRDGVLNKLINRDSGIKTSPWSLSEFDLNPNFYKSMSILMAANFKRFVVTNQPDILDGPMSFKNLHEMNEVLYSSVDDIFCALERDSKYYKPNNGMIEYYMAKYDIDRKKSYLIGDRWKDIVAAKRSSIKTIYIGEAYLSPSEYEHIKPDYIAKDLLAACELIVDGER